MPQRIGHGINDIIYLVIIRPRYGYNLQSIAISLPVFCLSVWLSVWLSARAHTVWTQTEMY